MSDKIKVEELRIGNIVRFPYRTEYKPVADIERLEQDGGHYEYYVSSKSDKFPRHISQITPIPITPEILERVGFDHIHLGGRSMIMKDEPYGTKFRVSAEDLPSLYEHRKKIT